MRIKPFLDRRSFCHLLSALILGLRTEPLRPFRTMYFFDYAPLSWQVGTGQMRGLFVDVLDHILGGGIGMTMSHEGLPWGRAQSLVRKGQADGMCTVPTDERLTFCVPTLEPVFTGSMKMVVKRGSRSYDELRGVDSVHDLKHFRGGSYLGNGYAKKWLNGPRANWTRSLEQSLKMLMLDRIDVSLDIDAVLAFAISQLGYDQFLEILPQSLSQVPYHFMISKKSPHLNLIEGFDQALAMMKTNGTHAEILEEYIPLL